MVKTVLRTLPIALLIGSAAGGTKAGPTPASTYFIDCHAGSDDAAGTTPATAWRTIDAANRRTFAPGDGLRLKSGCEWTGTLSPQGSGTTGQPITIDRFGDGPLPLIKGNGAVAAILLTDQEYWELSNLQVTNDAAEPGLRRGVLIRTLAPEGTFHHLYVRGVHVRHVRGQLGAEMEAKATGGIGFETRGRGSAARFDDVRIEDCVIESVDNVGIYLWSEPGPNPRHPRWADLHYRNIVVRGNRLHDIGKNAIIVRASVAPLIERNVVTNAAARLHGNAIFVFGTRDAVLQFNEVSGTRFYGLEGAAYDSDYNSEGTIIQYNYSYNNGGGLANICSNPPRGFNDGTIIRYNVSRDETDRVIAFDGPATNTQIYNNTLVIGPDRSPRIVEFDVFGGTQGFADGVIFRNNIIHNLGRGTYAWGGATRVTFEANCFSGSRPLNEPDDSRKVFADPLFVAPGRVSAGWASAAGYALAPGSPCAGTGVTVPGSGGRDYLGTSLPASSPDRGAMQTSRVSTQRGRQ